MSFLSFLLFLLQDGQRYSHFNGQKHHSEFIKSTASQGPTPMVSGVGPGMHSFKPTPSPANSASGGPWTIFQGTLLRTCLLPTGSNFRKSRNNSVYRNSSSIKFPYKNNSIYLQSLRCYKIIHHIRLGIQSNKVYIRRVGCGVCISSYFGF